MDGSNAAFLLDTPLFSPNVQRPANGILYIEDFDAGPEPVSPVPPAAEPTPHYAAEDLRAARASGREEGLQAALADEGLLQAQLRSAALQSVADGLADARASLASLARTQAEDFCLTMIAILQAAVPTVMRSHAGMELNSVIAAVLPGLICEPELRVRAHPVMTDMVREALAGQLPAERCVLSVCADPDMAEGDIKLAWRDGHAHRDCAAVWDTIVSALASLNLPTFKDIDDGN